MARFYVDTSAYLCVLLGEAGAGPLIAELAGGELLSSSLLALEAYRTLVRLSREGLLSASDFRKVAARLDDDLEQFSLRDLTLELCRERVIPLTSTPRSLDLVHLWTALWFHRQEPIARFVTVDEPQGQAARELGLPA